MKRLDSLSAKLAVDFRMANHECQKSAVLAVCRFAASGTSTDQSNKAISLLSHGRWRDAALCAELSAAAARFDDEYLSETTDTTLSLSSVADLLFRKARLASALEFALSTATGKLEEALYEAIAACESQALGISTAIAALR